ncbi:hypothetical protein HC031_10975 [Planosporangium thailandense]|uniref:Secreted protein n=1 Tax=Planosporangium thailandense TaxID=765197 RepID=A0ABX0XW01_9ACTN|nr:hypothetical protein [Planosporangium thailandense]NJC70228.1 hypothetical protein [Planosporangium thailandense]
MRINPRLLAVSVLGVAAAVVGVSSLGHALPATAADGTPSPDSLVETYDYPNGDKTTGIKLIKGDGHILLVGCDAGKTSALVWSYNSDQPYCFQFTGKTGYVTLELHDVYGIRNYNDFDISAKVSTVKDPIPVPKDSWKGVGVAGGTGPAILLELRSQS